MNRLPSLHRRIAAGLLVPALLLSGCRAATRAPEPTATVPVPAVTASAVPTALPATLPPTSGVPEQATPQPAETLAAPSSPTTPSAAPAVTVAWPPTAVPGLPDLADLEPGWNQLAPGGATECARGTPYAFWARPGRPDRLLVFFEGGGGCWDAGTCSPGSPFFKDTVSPRDDPSLQGGIFDLANPANPFRDWSFVFVAYCTGDVHWGNNVQNYPTAEGGSLTIRHVGFVNASAALAWAFEQFPAVESVFVTGCSAGAVGSAVFAPYIAEAYPAARLAQLGDSLAFVYPRPLDLQANYRARDQFPAWIPSLAAIAPGEFTMARYYAALANYYPDYTFAQFNTAADAVQEQFYLALGGQPGRFPADLAGSLREIREAAPNFRSYTAPGSQHCVLPFDRFYTLAEGGVTLRDWVAQLAEGEAVPTVGPG